MTRKWKAILLTAGLVVLLTLVVTLIFALPSKDRRATEAVPLGGSYVVSAGNKAEPEHHTVTVICPGTVSLCTGGRVTLQTSDGGSSVQSFSLGGGTSTAVTFTGLTGGGAALDTANPKVYCLAGVDSTTIPMGPGASVTGGPISPGTFTVPAGIAATATIACQ